MSEGTGSLRGYENGFRRGMIGMKRFLRVLEVKIEYQGYQRV